MKKNLEKEKWEGLCKGCGQCCHNKYNLLIYSLADPEYVCEHLSDENTCDIYLHRLNTKGTNCMGLKMAIKKTGLLALDCGYIHLNLQHQPFIMPRSTEEFWELVKMAEVILNKKFEKEIDLVSLVSTNRKENKGIKFREKTG